MSAPPVQYVKTVDGTDIATYTAGGGPVLIRTPTLWNHVSRQWTEELFGPTFEALAERCRLVLYDGRGQGLSTRNLRESTHLEDFLLDLDAVVKHAGAEQFVLTGWSFMAVVAIRYAVENPQRVRALVLWDYTDMSASATSTNMIEIAESDWRLFVETTARTGFGQFDPKAVTPVLFDAMTQADHVRQAKAVIAASGEELLEQVTAPTLFLATRTGTRVYSAEDSAKRWSAMLPDAQLVLVDEAGGGWLPIDGAVPTAVQAIQNFLASRKTDYAGRDGRVGALSVLSPRQCEVLRLLAQGKSNREIADELVISLNTVQNHIKTIYRLANLTNRAQAAIYARDNGII